MVQAPVLHTETNNHDQELNHVISNNSTNTSSNHSKDGDSDLRTRHRSSTNSDEVGRHNQGIRPQQSVLCPYAYINCIFL